MHLPPPASVDPELYRESSILLGQRLFVANYKGVIEPNNPLLALDQRGQPIPGTYLGSIEEMPQTFPPEAMEQVQELREGFLFYATPWHTNFQHFLTETFPKVMDYLELVRSRGRALPLLMPHFILNSFVHEVMGLLGIESSLVLLRTPALYRVENLYSSSYVPNYDPPTPKVIAAFRLLRDLAQRTFPPAPAPRGRRIYLARDKQPNLGRNNSNAGVKRVITNEDAVQETLYTLGFEDVLMGNLEIQGKMQALAGAEFIVSPIGANLMNLLFLTPPYPRRIVILHSSYLSVHATYFKGLLGALYDHRITVELFEGPAEAETENSPYALDLGQFTHVMKCALHAWAPRMFPTAPSEAPC